MSARASASRKKRKRKPIVFAPLHVSSGSEQLKYFEVFFLVGEFVLFIAEFCVIDA